jgi:hypothetical protein
MLYHHGQLRKLFSPVKVLVVELVRKFDSVVAEIISLSKSKFL